MGDFSAALTRHVSRAGHDVRLFIPAYGTIDWSDREVGEVEFLHDVPLRIGDRTLRFTGRYSYLPGISVQVYFIDCPELYRRPSIYTDDADEALRFAFLTRAAIECCQRMGWAPHVFHCNDWHTAMLPVQLRSSYRWDSLFGGSRTMLTIHNIGYQGVFDAETLSGIGMSEDAVMFPRDDLEAGKVNFLHTGLLHVDLITTVSPTYAREIQTPEYGMGLDGLLRHRADRMVGILNGVDYDEWDPSHDELIPFRYTRDDLTGKVRNKRTLLKEVSLPYVARTPVVGMISRLVQQKGIDLLPKVLPELLDKRDFYLIVLGSGEDRYESFCQSLPERFPERVFFYRGYNNELAHLIEAGSDIFLMPSLYEPCGLNQMYSLRYGSVPVVRNTGGLADSVDPFNAEGRTGTGFVFQHFEPAGLRWSLNQALDIYPHRRLWRQLVRNGMSRDFSWERQAGRYVELYRRLAQS